MSAIKIVVEHREFPTKRCYSIVYVDEKVAYQSLNTQTTEAHNLRKLIELIPIENTEVEMK